MARSTNASGVGATVSVARPKRRRGRPAGTGGAAYEVRRHELIAEALDFRRQGFSYRQIAEATGVTVKTAFVRVQKGLAANPTEAVQELLKLALDQCEEIMQRLMPLLDDDPLAAIGGILKVQDQILLLHGVGVEGEGEGEDGSEAILIQRIKASAPVMGGGPQVEPEHIAEARKAWRRKHGIPVR